MLPPGAAPAGRFGRPVTEALNSTGNRTRSPGEAHFGSSLRHPRRPVGRCTVGRLYKGPRYWAWRRI